MILLDTHAALWLTIEPERLPRRVKTFLSAARQQAEIIAISSITLFEAAYAIQRGRVLVLLSLDSFLNEWEARFTLLPLTAAIATATTRLPESYPGDPADRIIGATALVHGAALVTADERIRKSKAVRTLW